MNELPKSDAGIPSGADADLRTLTPSGSAGGFSVTAVELEDDTDCCVHGRRYCQACAHAFGPQWLDPQDARLLARLPHGAGSL